MSQFLASGGQSIGASASASVLPMRNRMDRCKFSQCGNQHGSAWWGGVGAGSLHCLEPEQLVIPFGDIWCFCYTSHIPMSMRPSSGSGSAGERTRDIYRIAVQGSARWHLCRPHRLPLPACLWGGNWGLGEPGPCLPVHCSPHVSAQTPSCCSF